MEITYDRREGGCGGNEHEGVLRAKELEFTMARGNGAKISNTKKWNVEV